VPNRPAPVRGCVAPRDLEEASPPLSKSTILASGAVTRTDTVRIELHQPSDSPAFALVVWRVAPTVTAASPKAIASIAYAVVRILAEGQTRLSTSRRG